VETKFKAPNKRKRGLHIKSYGQSTEKGGKESSKFQKNTRTAED
jgi:hypothetical protein